jgi:hypothetical protein
VQPAHRPRTSPPYQPPQKIHHQFSVPEGGKVGVVGSGRGMTDYKKAGRHEFSVDGQQ